MFAPYGTYTSQKAEFEIECGLGQQNPKIYLRTAKEPDSIIGITKVKGIWGDEAGKYPLYFWENLQGRSAFKDCPIMLTTSPYSLNWIYKELIKPSRQGKRDDVLIIQASSNENPYFPQKSYENLKKTMDPRRFKMMYDGVFDRMQGLVYDCFDETENQCEPVKLPDGTRYYAGVDFGFTDPFVVKVRAITPKGDHFSVSEFCKPGLTPSEVIDVCKQKQQVYSIKQFYCDPSQPGLIEEINRRFAKDSIKSGAVGADNDIARGIGLHYELIKTRRLKFFTGQNPHTLDEIEVYHYPEPKDLGPDDDGKDENPVDANNHCNDADRYVTISTFNLTGMNQPRVPIDLAAKSPQESNQARIRRLMRRRNTSQTEDFSE